jgi:hypothetical protein
MGRILKIIWLMSNVISLSIITSIISAKLTTAGLAVKRIQKLGDITGTLCIESACVLVLAALPARARAELSVCAQLPRRNAVCAAGARCAALPSVRRLLTPRLRLPRRRTQTDL